MTKLEILQTRLDKMKSDGLIYFKINLNRIKIQLDTIMYSMIKDIAGNVNEILDAVEDNQTELLNFNDLNKVYNK
jgi:hypothetical protein